MGANYGQTVKSFVEAEAYPGTSLILAYSPCIEHKIIFPRGLSRLADEMKKAVDSGYWMLYRYNPLLGNQGSNPFTLDSKRMSIPMSEFTDMENRFRTLFRTLPDVAESLESELQNWAHHRLESYKKRDEDYGGMEDKGSIPLTILVGTDTGTTMELALRTAVACRSRDFDVKLLEMDEISEISDLGDHPNVLLMCSTAGEGDIPATALGFWEVLSAPDLPQDSLKGISFCAFGLGDRGYRHFNKAIKDIDTRFEELGATRQMITGLGDDQDDDKYETAFEEWIPEFYKTHQAPEPKNDHLIPAPLFELRHMSAEEKWEYKQIAAPGTKEILLETNERITPQDYDRIIYHLKFDVSGTDFSYLLGDALSVYPRNDPDAVTKFLRDYHINPDQNFKVLSLGEIDERRRVAYRRPLSVQQIFTEVVDILGRPTKHFYKGLGRFATDPTEKEELDLIVSDTPEGKEAYMALVNETVTYVDILNRFKSAHPPLEHLMSMIPCIKPRLYSIASSQRYDYDKLELVIVVLDWKTASGADRRGLSTDFIDRITTDNDPALKFNQTIPCGIVNGSFKFPEDKKTPMVMTGLGTGLAPFRAFIQEWSWYRKQGVETGPMWLFYGCRHQSKDYILGDELEQFHKDGVLSELRPAFSRDQKEKIYVQNRMSEVSAQMYTDLIQKEGYFYLCGQAGALERDVEAAIRKAVKEGAQCSEEQAQEVVDKMHEDGRYNLELY